MGEGTSTWVVEQRDNDWSVKIRKCRLSVSAGPDHGKTLEFADPEIVIGRSSGQLVLADPKVSALHAEVRITPEGFRIRDLDSSNGTFVDGVRVLDGFMRPGATLTLGGTSLLFEVLDDAVALPLWPEPHLAGLVGGSTAMRRLYDLINRYAARDTTVLIQGETGSGKELVAAALHRCSPRAAGPFVVVDCSAIPEHLAEDQLFGHAAGAFTDAVHDMPGAFEAAHGGTLFLDEIGELPLPIQTKLLRAVETRVVQRLGSTSSIACDVRVLAATNRDLAGEVNRGTFRGDLYYRLAVATLWVPPLRQRREDIPLLIAHFLKEHDPTGQLSLGEDFMVRAWRHNWPGNIRELRNAIERALLNAPPEPLPEQPAILHPPDLGLPFKVAKQHVVDEFDRLYVLALMARHDYNLSAAAKAAGVERMTIYNIVRRLGLEREMPVR